MIKQRLRFTMYMLTTMNVNAILTRVLDEVRLYSRTLHVSKTRLLIGQGMLPGLQELYLQLQAIRTKSFITARNRNSILKLVKLQNSVAKCCKIRKIFSPAKFANFYDICVTHRKGRQSLPHLSRKYFSYLRRFCHQNLQLY